MLIRYLSEKPRDWMAMMLIPSAIRCAESVICELFNNRMPPQRFPKDFFYHIFDSIVDKTHNIYDDHHFHGSGMGLYHIFQNVPIFLLNSEEVKEFNGFALEKFCFSESEWYSDDFDHSIWRSSEDENEKWREEDEDRWRRPTNEDIIWDKNRDLEDDYDEDDEIGPGLIDPLALHMRGDFSKSYAAQNISKELLYPIQLEHGGTESWIVIFVDKIQKSAANPDEFKKMFVITLLHELMHELMYSRTKQCCADVDYTTAFGYKNEEMFANALSLALLAGSGFIKLFDYAKCFMSKQPFAYRLGLHYFNRFGYHVVICADSYVDQKLNGAPIGFINEWLKITCGYRRWSRIKDLEEVRWRRCLLYEYRGKYKGYDESCVLVIVKEWIEAQLSKPTFADLKDAFPDSLPDSGTMFKKWPTQGATYKDNYEIFQKNLQEGEKFQYSSPHTNGCDVELINLRDCTVVVSALFNDNSFEKFAKHVNNNVPEISDEIRILK